MTNAQSNAVFLNKIGKSASNEILDSIGRHYGISRNEAFEEVTDDEAEMILEYMTGVERLAASVLAQRNMVA